MCEYMQNGAKKSFYIFLSGLLGILLFILLERSLFLLAFLLGVDVLSGKFAQIDYAAFIAATTLGLWYGIWVGLYWYQIVYEERTHAGVFGGMWNKLSGTPTSRSFKDQDQAWDFDDLMKVKTGEFESGTVEPRLEVFESNTITFSSRNPLHADQLHNTREVIVPSAKPKRTVKRVSKKTTK